MRTSSASLENIRRLGKQIKAAGFGYVKVELEADFGRRNYQRQTHDACSRGFVLCPKCKGSGVYRRAICSSCLGRAGLPCTDPVCHGGYVGVDFRSDRQTAEWLRERIPAFIRERLIFMQFYADGSCGSEVTFTISTEELHLIVPIIKAFYSIKDHTKYCDIRGSGIHIAVMVNDHYPSSTRLPAAKINNFKRQVVKLLPAIFFLGASGSKTRSLEFRHPAIGSEEGRRPGRKYSAIYTRDDTILEYRIFETCYKRPEMIYDYLAMIANTLDYYKHPRKRVKDFNHEFIFRTGNDLSRFYMDPRSLEILDEQVLMIKPSWKSLKQLKMERGFNKITPERVIRRLRIKDAFLEEQFEDLIQHDPRMFGDRQHLVYRAQELLGYDEMRALEESAENPTKLRWELFKADNYRPIRARLEV